MADVRINVGTLACRARLERDAAPLTCANWSVSCHTESASFTCAGAAKHVPLARPRPSREGPRAGISLAPPASHVSAGSGSSGLLGGTDPLAVEQPDNERQDGTDVRPLRPADRDSQS